MHMHMHMCMCMCVCMCVCTCTCMCMCMYGCKCASAASRVSSTPGTSPSPNAARISIATAGPAQAMDCKILRAFVRVTPSSDCSKSQAAPALSEPMPPAMKGRSDAEEAAAVSMPNW